MTTRLLLHAIILFIIACINLSNADEQHCWPASERKTLTFINNANKNMTHLTTVRLIEGYYPSQFAMQYAAYVYLKEKMGIDVCLIYSYTIYGINICSR